MNELKNEIGEEQIADDIKLQLHNMKNLLNDINREEIKLEESDKQLLINLFKEEIYDNIEDKTEEIYIDIIDILYRIGVTPEELGIDDK
jgi:hypothetical protein